MDAQFDAFVVEPEDADSDGFEEYFADGCVGISLFAEGEAEGLVEFAAEDEDRFGWEFESVHFVTPGLSVDGWHFHAQLKCSDSLVILPVFVGKIAPLPEQAENKCDYPQVRRLREQPSMTQEDLAARCNLLGWNISRGTLAKIESQVRRVTDDEVALMAEALKVDIAAHYAGRD